MIYGPVTIVLIFCLAPPFLAASAAELIRFRLVPQESRVLTQIAHPFGAVKGELRLSEGEAEGQLNDIKNSGRVMLSLEAASYNSNLGLRDQDVQENYLEVKQHPVISFTSTGIEDLRPPVFPDTAWKFIVKGRLKLHGAEREIRVPVKLTYLGRKIIVEGTTKILLKDFNISVPTLLFIRSGDEVEVNFRFVGEQQS